ncbi:hypothetical protein CDD83_7667 [Cordyceps sp. RAO-2017]|nr:hypothetical protein CDD83_7667 [Cordyceps sp. RAO-2017]
MADEPSLPRLPDAAPPSLLNKPRKRLRNDLLPGKASPLSFDSSDPAVFSSDDDPGLDNYVEGRRKKRYIGSWYQQHPASSDSTLGDDAAAPRRPKRTFARQVDSGVFLGSDGTDGEDMAEALSVPARAKLPQLEKRPVATVSQAELTAREVVRRCIEQGHESLDFWSLGLEELSDETIAPLATFSCIPVVTRDVAFEQREPELKIYLATNRLRQMPAALFDLTHLTILSLRGNKLAELPPAIAKLRSLKELNVSQNRLTSLPAELLDLLGPQGSLHTLAVRPNPLYEPEQPFEPETVGTGDFWEVDDAARNLHFATRLLGQSPLQLCDSRGEVVSEFRLPSGVAPQKVAVVEPPDAAPEEPDSTSRPCAARPSCVPSLVEASLRSCYSSSLLSELPRYMPDDLPHLQRLLERASRQKQMGGLNCSRCRRLLVVPTMTWVEWREVRKIERADEAGQGEMTARPSRSLSQDETAVPFLHRACSWKCGPSP